jgi:hypothetical protein
MTNSEIITSTFFAKTTFETFLPILPRKYITLFKSTFNTSEKVIKKCNFHSDNLKEIIYNLLNVCLSGLTPKNQIHGNLP